MAQARSFLDRFRPAGAPGAAARAGVPADWARELAAELGPVLALLDEVHEECGLIIESAHTEAAQITAAAQAEAAKIAAESTRRAQAAREQAAHGLLAEAQDQASRDEAAASREAAQTRRLVKRRMPVLITRAVRLATAGTGAGERP